MCDNEIRIPLTRLLIERKAILGTVLIYMKF
jgi:hypothetical protein